MPTKTQFKEKGANLTDYQDSVKGKKKKHYIHTVPQETQRSLFSQKTVHLAHRAVLIHLTLSAVLQFQLEGQETQVADLSSGRRAGRIGGAAGPTLMIVT